MRRLGAVLAAVLATGVAASAAGADGLPVGGVDAGPSGVPHPAGVVRYVALRTGPGTLVAAVEQDGGRVARWRLLDGRFTVPAVALDATPAGLSGDGRTLVLIRPRPGFPRERTSFAILNARRLALRERIVLRGDFSFDAISPDGSLLYLIQYVNPRDPTQYVVRGYDLRAGRLLPDPIVDPKVFGDLMRGYPLTRVTSADGRWAYTLYDGGGGHPFVHALDTAQTTAACIDLDALAGRADLAEVRLELSKDEGELRVVERGETVAAIDTETLRLVEPAAAPGPEPPAAEEPADTSTAALTAAGAALALAGLGIAGLRRRAHRADRESP